MDWMEHFISWLLGVLGGVVDLLIKEEYDWKKILARGFIGGFVGYMAVLFVKGMKFFSLNVELIGFIAGMSGYLGPVLLELFARRVKKMLRVDENGR